MPLRQEASIPELLLHCGSIRPKNWKPNAEKQKEIDEKIETNPKLKDAVKFAQKEAAKKKEDKEKASDQVGSARASDDEATDPKRLIYLFIYLTLK